MARIHRVAFLLLAGVLWAWCQASHASIPGTTNKQWQGKADGVWYDDIGSAAAASVGKFGSYANCQGFSIYPGAVASVNPSNDSFTFVWFYCTGQSLGSTDTSFLATRTGLQCPSHSSPDGAGACSCDSPFIENSAHTQCVSLAQQVCDLSKGLTLWSTTTGAIPTVGSLTCMPAGCTGTWGSTVSYTDKATGKTETEGPVTFDGGTCTYDSSASAKTTFDNCKGGTLGEVNGISKCIPFDPDLNVIQSSKSTPSVTTTVTTSSPSGTSTTSTTVTTPATPGTSTTKCDGGSCQTTTTTTKSNPDGTTETSTVTKDQPQADYCAEHPNDPACAKPGSFGGSCAAGFECSGDAAMCAAARGVWEQKCALVDGPASPNAEQQAYAQAVDPSGTGYALTTTTLSISGANFDSSNSLPIGGQCLTNQSVTVWGKSIELPFSSVCPHLATLGTIMLALAWLIAAGIVGKGVTQ